jgi:endonuclease/exonuclease/phosphatase family metal-dependent hydrolase
MNTSGARSMLLFGLVTALTLLSALSCGGGPKKTRLLIIDQNILHGLLDEDPAAQPFDRFPERIRLIAAALAEAQPDAVMLQEVLPGYAADPDYADVRQVLLGALGTDYTAVFGDITGAPRDEGFIGQMTLTRLPIISTDNRVVANARSVLRVTVETEHGPLDLYNAHLEGTGALTEAGEDASVVEMENVLAFIRETRSEGGSVVLAGDLNAHPDDPSVQLLRDEGFVDALAEGGDATCEQPGDPGCTNSAIPLGDNPDNGADQRIDYIFVLPGAAFPLNVAEVELFLNQPIDIGEGRLLWASDHIGVRALLEVDEP